jgi:hypothetical protein
MSSTLWFSSERRVKKYEIPAVVDPKLDSRRTELLPSVAYTEQRIDLTTHRVIF